MHVINIKGGWSGQLTMHTKIFPQKFLLKGVLVAKHGFATIAYVGDITVLPVDILSHSKRLKRWGKNPNRHKLRLMGCDQIGLFPPTLNNLTYFKLPSRYM